MIVTLENRMREWVRIISLLTTTIFNFSILPTPLSLQFLYTRTFWNDPETLDWDLNPCAGTRTQPKPYLGPELCGWDSDPAKTHSTWFLDLMKLRFLMYHCRKNSVGDKGLGSVQLSSVVQSCLTLCDPMGCSTPGFPVHHQLPELTQTHVHWIGDAIQPYQPLFSPSPSTFNLSQHQDLFQWISSLHQVAKLLEFQLQHQSFQWILRSDFL